MSNVTLNGNGYSDDGSQSRDMRYGGYRNWLVPMMSDVMSEVSGVGALVAAAAGSAGDASASATAAQNYAAALSGTSATSTAIGTGSKTFTTQSGKQFAAGQWVTVVRASDVNAWMYGQVTSYSGSTLIINVTLINGSGTYTDWTISIAGTRGATGATGAGLPSFTGADARKIMAVNAAGTGTEWIAALGVNLTVQAGDYSATANKEEIVCTPSASGYAITLPNASALNPGAYHKVINRSASYAVTLLDSTGVPVYIVAANKAVLVTLEVGGTASGLWRVAECTAPVTYKTTFSGANTTLRALKTMQSTLPLGGNKFLVAAGQGGVAGSIDLFVATVSGMTVSIGAVTNIPTIAPNSTASYAGFKLVAAGSSYVLVFCSQTGPDLTAVACTVSGTTVSVGSTTTIKAAIASVSGMAWDVCANGATGVFTYMTSVTAVVSKVFTVAGTTLTLGAETTTATVANFSFGNNGFSTKLLTPTLYCLFGWEGLYGTSCAFAVAATLSGTNISPGGRVNYSSGVTYNSIGLAAVDSTKCVAYLATQSSSQVVNISISGVTPSFSSSVVQNYSGTPTNSVGWLHNIPGTSKFTFAVPGTLGLAVVDASGASPTNVGTYLVNTKASFAVALSATRVVAADNAGVLTINTESMPYPGLMTSAAAVVNGSNPASTNPNLFLTGANELVDFNASGSTARVIRWSE